MRVLVQRVTEVRVTVSGKVISKIGKGFLLLVGINTGDTPQDLDWMAQKVANLRIFDDEKGKLNLNILQVNGEILSVPQFTLCADMTRGNRPGFDPSAKPEIAKSFWQAFNKNLSTKEISVQEGEFGAHMEVQLVNDGPVTIWLATEEKAG